MLWYVIWIMGRTRGVINTSFGVLRTKTLSIIHYRGHHNDLLIRRENWKYFQNMPGVVCDKLNMKYLKIYDSIRSTESEHLVHVGSVN